MKQLLFFIVLIVVVGFGALVYRNVLERPAGSTPGITACTMEARVCPDGTSVGRTGPNCAFAACPAPNVEIADANIAFVLPAGYTQTLSGAPQQDVLRIYSKPSKTPDSEHSIHIERYAIPTGQTGEQVILAHTRYEPSDMPAQDMSKFTTVTLGGHMFRETTIERNEGIVESAYFLVRDTDVLRFSIVEHDVDWTNPSLDIENLPEHKALRAMLTTLQTY